MKTELITTKDGSHTLFVPELNEHYHSTYGAIEEAEHIFIKAGVSPIEKNETSIFEMGFGTGLNAFLTAVFSEINNIKIEYTAIEKYPVSSNTNKELNYSSLIQDGKYKNVINSLHNAEWGKKTDISKNFNLEKFKSGIQKFEAEKKFDVIYFDAFAPNKQPEVWSFDIFKKIISWLNPQGRIVTYTAKGEVRRTWLKLGLKVEKLPGPPGKREFLVGTK